MVGILVRHVRLHQRRRECRGGLPVVGGFNMGGCYEGSRSFLVLHMANFSVEIKMKTLI